MTVTYAPLTEDEIRATAHYFTPEGTVSRLCRDLLRARELLRRMEAEHVRVVDLSEKVVLPQCTHPKGPHHGGRQDCNGPPRPAEEWCNECLFALATCSPYDTIDEARAFLGLDP